MYLWAPVQPLIPWRIGETNQGVTNTQIHKGEAGGVDPVGFNGRSHAD